MLSDALGMMLTLTTHGTSLSEEERACVEHDVILPAEPIREEDAPQGDTSSPVLLPRGELRYVGRLVGEALQGQLGLRIWALAVQVWYAHLVVAATKQRIDQIVQCADDAARAGLDWKRPIWEPECDRRLCFDTETVLRWIAYVERHNTASDLPPKPWPFIETPDF